MKRFLETLNSIRITMFIYNITINVNWIIHDEWLQWLYKIYLPFAMNRGCFKRYQLVKLLQTDDAEGPTYAVQLFAESKADYNHYIEIYLPEIEQKSFQKWPGNMLTYATLMEVIGASET